ncbi:MAG: cytochrome c [Sulfuriferula multivorans]|uniref:Cytochrome c n=1 Tax=Sulfuriferula multivorans TaxID=1559896 RepID=A0A7C9K9H0_9PROT|nr:cytochrome c [Sulfuriferula multivorans]
MKATALILSLGLLMATAGWADSTGHASHHSGKPSGALPIARQQVAFPARLKTETLANMRDHLLAIQEITAYLAEKQFDVAAEVAETRLGFSSLQRHGAHEVAKVMPEGMRTMGHAMHQAASQLAVTAQTSGATGDISPALRALSRVQRSCVACHSAYALK